MTRTVHHLPPVLLTVASYYGTLAAARCLGRAGIAVTMADSRWMAPARWSRYVTNRVRCPSTEEPEQFVDWLLSFGRKHPGHVLYPTSDDVAWLLSTFRDVLAPFFHLFQPPANVLSRLLDKRELFGACRDVGIKTPGTYFPKNVADIEAIGASAAFPLLLKPAMQVLLNSRNKGFMVQDPEALLAGFHAFRALNRFHPWLLERVPDADLPILQDFHTGAARGIYTVAGFMSEDGIVALGAKKVLQRPRKLGIGLCFEEAALRPELLDGLAALCRHVGYFGVFEVEFIESNGDFLLIDFNPRFYSQMAFDVDRGLPLPLMAYEAALGRRDALDLAQRTVRPGANGLHGQVYTHRLVLKLMTRAQQLSGKMTSTEANGWRRWYDEHRGRRSDAVVDSGDRLPAFVDAATTAYAYARHPRAFVRTMILDR